MRVCVYIVCVSQEIPRDESARFTARKYLLFSFVFSLSYFIIRGLRVRASEFSQTQGNAEDMHNGRDTPLCARSSPGYNTILLHIVSRETTLCVLHINNRTETRAARVRSIVLYISKLLRGDYALSFRAKDKSIFSLRRLCNTTIFALRDCVVAPLLFL